MGDVTTAKESSAPSNPNVQPTVSKLLTGLQKQYDAGVPVFQKSLYPGVSDTTRSAWSQGSGVANNLIGSGGFNPTQKSAMGQINGLYGQYGAANTNAQSGGTLNTMRGAGSQYAGLADAYDQDAPGYSTLRSNLMDDAVKNVGAGFVNSGRFGGGSYIDTATKSAVDAVAPLDYTNFQNDINNRYRSIDSQVGIANQMYGIGQSDLGNRLRSLDSQAGLGQALFGMGQQGVANQNAAVSALGAIGSAKDADMLAARQGENDLFRRQNDAGWERLARSSAILGGTAPYGGTESSTSVPWWMAGLGAGATALGAFG